MTFPYPHSDFERHSLKRTEEHDVSEIEMLRNQILTLERSLGEGFAPNTRTAEEELKELRQKLDALEHNSAKKLFQKPKGADNQVAL